MNEGIDISEVIIRPGVYFNPQTEVLVVVDDSPEIDREIFNLEEFEGADWVMISDEVPVDEDRRDEILQSFQTHYHAGDSTSISAASNGDDADSEPEEEVEEQEVGRD